MQARCREAKAGKGGAKLWIVMLRAFARKGGEDQRLPDRDGGCLYLGNVCVSLLLLTPNTEDSILGGFPSRFEPAGNNFGLCTELSGPRQRFLPRPGGDARPCRHRAVLT